MRTTWTARPVAALAALAWAAAWGCGARADGRDARAAARGAADGEILVPQEKVQRGEALIVDVREQELRQAIDAAGRVAFDDQRVQHLLSPVSGQVTRVLARPGQKVKPGTPLVALLSPEVGSALADVVKAEADLAQAAAELSRQERLAQAGASPRHDLEAAQEVHGKAVAELARARQRAALLRSTDFDAVSQELTLRSAIAGEVIARDVSPGAQIQGTSSGGSPAELFTLGDIDQVWILADVAEEDAGRVKVGAEATLAVAAWPGRAFHGQVDLVAGALDPALRTVRVRIAMDNADHALRPEMLAEVSIAAPPRRGLALPRKAITAIEGQPFAYVVAGDDGHGRLRCVRRRLRISGDPGEALAVVESGLAAGDRVLADAPDREQVQGEVRLWPRQLGPSGIRVARVAPQESGGALTLGGHVTFDDVSVAHVFAPVAGRVVRVLAQPGQRVKRGAPLLAILSPEVGSAFADAVKAQADLVAAGHELRRQRELVEAHAGAPRDLETAEAAWRKARAELDRAQQKTRLLATGSWDAVTQELTLRSPIDGEVVARAAAPGLEVQGQWAGAGSPVELFTIGALDRLAVMGEVYEMDLPEVRAGQEVTVRVPAFPDRTFHGRVDWIASALDPSTRTARVRCVVDNPGGLLRPEMAPVLAIALAGQGRLAVPRTAVLRLGDDVVVFVAAGTAPDGQAVFRRRTVQIGSDRQDGTVEILGGLAAGEDVVVNGGIFLVGLL
jgi:cobalt-zinc-cadmium efflux system membrane fusion protein